VSSTVRERTEDELRPRTINGPLVAGATIAVTTLLHLFLALRFPLAPDELYYWQWSRHLDWGYYDQGPMIAWWIKASTLLFGHTPLGVRFGIVVAALLTQIYLYLLARDLFNPRIAALALLPAVLMPISMVGGMIATYDPLMVLFWSTAMYYAARATLFNAPRSWYAAGIAFGLGLLSKHTMLFFVPCLLFFLAALPDQRKWFFRKDPYVAFLLGLLVFLPNVIWQSQHDWVTFEHLFLLTGKGLDQPFGRRFGDFVGSQVALVSPLLFFLFIAALIWAARQRGRAGCGERLWYLFCMAAPVLVLFTVMTVKSKVQANWAVSGWLAPPILAVVWVKEKVKQAGGWRRTFAAHFTVAAALSGAFLSALLVWPEVRPMLRINVPPKWDQMNKLYGGAELGAAADREVKAMEAEGAGPVTVGSATYDNTSRLAFYMAGQPETYNFYLHTRMDSYALWQERLRPKPGSNALVADDKAPDDPTLTPFSAVFDRVVSVPEPVKVYRPGIYKEPVHTFYLYRCYGYRPNPAVETPVGG
jgi:hypothetical protein